MYGKKLQIKLIYHSVTLKIERKEQKKPSGQSQLRGNYKAQKLNRNYFTIFHIFLIFFFHLTNFKIASINKVKLQKKK